MFFTLGAIGAAIVSTITSAGAAAAATAGTALATAGTAAATAGTFVTGTAATLATKGLGVAAAAKGAGVLAAKGLSSAVARNVGSSAMRSMLVKGAEATAKTSAKHLAWCAAKGSAKGAYDAFRDYDDPRHKEKKTRPSPLGLIWDLPGECVSTAAEASVRKLLQL